MSRTKKLRLAVEAQLGHRIPNEVWDYAERKELAAKALAQDDPVETLAAEIKELMQLRGQAGPTDGFLQVPSASERDLMQLRRNAIAGLLGRLADQQPLVKSFRAEHLENRLISWQEVSGWIEARTDETGYVHAVVAGVPKGTSINYDRDGKLEVPENVRSQLRFERFAQVDSLDYQVPDDQWVRRVPIGRDGVLRTLQIVSTRLARYFGWEPAQATVFVLTGVVPRVSIVRATHNTGPILQLEEDPPGKMRYLSCVTRLTLKLDPSLTPAEVAEIYRHERESLFKQSLFKQRARSLSDKHLTLANFYTRYETLDRSAMRQWNQEYPDWKYERFSLFSRDVRVARARLLFEANPLE